MNLQELKGKTALVTGSSRGIGKGIAFALGKAGCRIVLNASRSEEELLETKKELEAASIECMAVLADVSNYQSCEILFQKVKETFGEVDILINNAGISHIGLFTDMTPDMWQHVLSANLGSVMNCTHLAVPSMVHKKEGIIVNISSMWGDAGASCEAVYAASKGGINAFTKSMAKELGPSHIRVNAIACGVIDTEMNRCFTEEERAALTEEIALMRFGTPKEVGELAVFLAGDRSSFLTGQIITLDGGML